MDAMEFGKYVDIARQKGADHAVIVDTSLVSDTSKNCIHPERMRPSMESCGIDVFQTARARGLPIEVVRDHAQQRDVYGLVLIE